MDSKLEYLDISSLYSLKKTYEEYLMEESTKKYHKNIIAYIEEINQELIKRGIKNEE